MLADGLIDASAQKPELIIDTATLTGAAKNRAWVTTITPCSASTIKLAARLLASAAAENEPFWRPPLAEFHRNQLPSNFAELNNTASAAIPAGTSTRRASCLHFVEKLP